MEVRKRTIYQTLEKPTYRIQAHIKPLSNFTIHVQVDKFL
jgi:hypothetical protein